MSTSKGRALALGLVALLMVAAGGATEADEERFGFGRPATEEEIAGWDIDVEPDGTGLPEGRGTVAQGEAIFNQSCVACHGQGGEGGPMDRLVGGFGSLDTDQPVKTVGSYWPYATTLYDYVNRAMPFDNPGSLTPDEVYAVVAYVLYLNDIVGEDAVMDAESLPRVEMPNRDGFIEVDPRPDVFNEVEETEEQE